MKQFLFTYTRPSAIGLIAAIFILFSASSCNKDGGSDNSFFRFKLNGADFEASGLLAYATNFSSDFTIYGVKSQSSTETCYINLPLGIAKGTYQLNDSDHSGYYIAPDNTAFSTLWGASSGSVTIDEIDATHVKGSFQFTAFDSSTETIKKTLTEGSFNVQFR